MISIAICDDEVKEREYVHCLLARYTKEYPQYEIKCYFFAAPLELIEYVAEHGGFDVLLLDVYMAGMLGTDAARELRRIGDEAEIIFLTTSKVHSLDAFEVDAAKYLVKPYGEAVFFASMNKVLERINVQKRDIITLKTSEGIIRLAIHNVTFTETGRNNYQTIHTIQGKKIEVRMTSVALFDILEQNKHFIKCGASLNINLKYIRQISKEAVTLDTGERIAFPYRSYSMMKENFLRFQMENED